MKLDPEKKKLLEQAKLRPTIYINSKDDIVIDHERFVYWFSLVVYELEHSDDLEDHEMPYHIFCAGAEAALRCQQELKIQ